MEYSHHNPCSNSCSNPRGTLCRLDELPDWIGIKHIFPDIWSVLIGHGLGGSQFWDRMEVSKEPTRKWTRTGLNSSNCDRASSMLGSIYLQDWLEFLVFPSERYSHSVIYCWWCACYMLRQWWCSSSVIPGKTARKALFSLDAWYSGLDLDSTLQFGCP